MSLILRRPNRLAFPGGNPGFDPSHQMVAGLVRGHGFSGVASNGNFISLLTGAPGTNILSPTAVIDGSLGPATGYIGSFNGVGSTFSGQSTANDTVATFGAIVRFNAASGGNYSFIFQNSTDGGSGGYGLAKAGNDALMVRVGASNIDASLAIGLLTIGAPYFLAASVNGAAIVNFVALRLDTGSLKAGTVTSATTAAPNGTYIVGNWGASLPANGGVACAMYAPRFASMQQLLAWAADPWSFWYPQKFNFAEMLGAASGPNVFTLPASQGSYLLTGSSSSLNSNRSVSVTKGIYSVTGKTTGMTSNRSLSVAQGVYTLTGKTVNLGRIATLLAAAGVYNLTGKTVTNPVKLSLNPVKGLYTVLGKFIDFIYNPVNPQIGGASYQKAYKKALEKRNEPRQQSPDIQYSASILARSGGHARAASLSANMRSKIASIAAKARWK